MVFGIYLITNGPPAMRGLTKALARLALSGGYNAIRIVLQMGFINARSHIPVDSGAL